MKIAYEKPLVEDIVLHVESDLLNESPGIGGNEGAGDNPDPVF